MARKNIISAIDVGTTKVATIIGEVNEGGDIRVIGVGICPSKGMHKALVVNMNEAIEAIKESVRRAERAANCRIDSAYIGVTGRHVSSTNNKGVVAITRNDRLVRSDDLKRVLSSAQSIKVPGDRKLLHVIPRDYVVDGQQGVKNPVGMHGYRLDVETHVITAAVTSVQNLVKCVRSAGVDVEELVLEPLASAEAVLTEDEKHDGVIIADIGGGTTDIAVFKDGSIWHTSVLPVAGYQLTRDVSIGLGVPFDVAEQMKRKYASVMPVYETKSETESNMISTDGHGVSYQDLCDIVRARVEEVLKLTLLELPRADYASMIPAGLVLTGGTCNLPGIDILARDVLHIPVRVGTPVEMKGIGEVLNDPAYATSVGLLLWGAKYEGKKLWQQNNGGFSFRRVISQLVSLFR